MTGNDDHKIKDDQWSPNTRLATLHPSTTSLESDWDINKVVEYYSIHKTVTYAMIDDSEIIRINYSRHLSPPPILSLLQLLLHLSPYHTHSLFYSSPQSILTHPSTPPLHPHRSFILSLVHTHVLSLAPTNFHSLSLVRTSTYTYLANLLLTLTTDHSVINKHRCSRRLLVDLVC